MDYRQRFLQISEFLETHRRLWEGEVIFHYPNILDFYPIDWIEMLESLDEKTLWQVDCLSNFSLISETDMGKWMSEIADLSKVSPIDPPETQNLPDWAFNKVKGKKRHEILILSEVFKELQQTKPFSHLVDIGGGVGHLARVMAHYKSIECISLDINEEFQTLGQKRLEKYPKPNDAKDVRFITHDFTNELEKDLTKAIFTKESFSLGLHTCGPLALRHIDCAINHKTRGLLNFGCCYNRLNPETDNNISTFAKENGVLGMDTYTFTLASRGHASMTLEDFKHKRRVKEYRYALHLYFYKEMGIEEMLPVGDSHHREYWGDFSDYAIKKIDKLGMQTSWNKEDFENFYHSKEIQRDLSHLFMANIIRWQIGRVLELYILLDRANYIEEKGLKVELKQFFDENQSPRNIGLLCTE